MYMACSGDEARRGENIGNQDPSKKFDLRYLGAGARCTFNEMAYVQLAKLIETRTYMWTEDISPY